MHDLSAKKKFYSKNKNVYYQKYSLLYMCRKIKINNLYSMLSHIPVVFVLFYVFHTNEVILL